jgi:Tol biopolymer transport system component
MIGGLRAGAGLLASGVAALAITTTATALVSAGSPLGAAHRTIGGSSGKIVFVVSHLKDGDVDRKRPTDLYSVKADGTGFARLARNASDPAASPDGRRIAFWRAGNLWVMDANGGNQRRLLKSTRWTYSPTWGADGASLFFLREDGIYRMRADGSGVQRVLKKTCLDDLAASPDGRRLAFVEWTTFGDPCDDAPRILASDLSGRNAHLAAGRWAEDPAWSPDGKLLAFSSLDAINGPPFGIYIVGKAPERRLTGRTGAPTWSPDGSQIAFADGDLWIIRADGKELRRMKHLPRRALSDPIWLPG